MTSNEKTLNYKVVDLVEIYKFCIKFISIWVHTKKVTIFKKQTNPAVVAHGGLPLPPWGHGGSRLILLNFEISTPKKNEVGTKIWSTLSLRSPARLPPHLRASALRVLRSHPTA
jgi:hypothetical protein